MKPLSFLSTDPDGAEHWRIGRTQEPHQTETEAQSCVKLIFVT